MNAVRLVAGAAIVALAVAACGGSSSSPAASAAGSQAPGATPAPTAAPTSEAPGGPTAEPSAGGGTATEGCADPTAMAAAMKNVDHYIATAKITSALPGSSTADLSLDLAMKYQKPDRVEISSGMGGAMSLFSTITIGEESWISMFGSDSWTKADASTSTSDADLFSSSFDASGLTPLTEIPSDLVLPGSSSCIIAYSMKMPEIASGDESNPLSALSGAAGFAVRVDTATNLPESMGFIIDPVKNEVGTPTSMVFVFDYATPVDIQAPDPSKITEGGAFPFPSGLVLPSGFELP